MTKFEGIISLALSCGAIGGFMGWCITATVAGLDFAVPGMFAGVQVGCLLGTLFPSDKE